MRNVLLIDDTPEIAELLTFALRDHGYEVFATGYTTSVSELIREHRVDALVLDCSTFDMSEAVLVSLRSDPSYTDLPIVIITDTPEKAEAKLRAQAARKVLLVQKPFTGGQVANALAQSLQ